jgi:hypothetical protein
MDISEPTTSDLINTGDQNNFCFAMVYNPTASIIQLYSHLQIEEEHLRPLVDVRENVYKIEIDISNIPDNCENLTPDSPELVCK